MKKKAATVTIIAAAVYRPAAAHASIVQTDLAHCLLLRPVVDAPAHPAPPVVAITASAAQPVFADNSRKETHCLEMLPELCLRRCTYKI